MWQEYPFLSGKETRNQPCVGISACLSGERVRYDGTSKIQPDLINQFSPLITLKPLCPEVAIGMGIPRRPMQLNLNNQLIDAVYKEDQAQSFTQPINQYADLIIDQYERDIASNKLCGYIFKSRSPSCGAGSTPVFSDGIHVRFGDGIFAHKLRQALPWLPVMEEEELEHPRSRNRFLFLVYLISDYHQSVEKKSDEQVFFAHHKALIKGLPRKKRTQLNSALEHGNCPEDLIYAPDCALTLLTESLQEISHHEFEEIITKARDTKP